MGLRQVQHALEAVGRYSVRAFGKRLVGAVTREAAHLEHAARGA